MLQKDLKWFQDMAVEHRRQRKDMGAILRKTFEVEHEKRHLRVLGR